MARPPCSNICFSRVHRANSPYLFFMGPGAPFIILNESTGSCEPRPQHARASTFECIAALLRCRPRDARRKLNASSAIFLLSIFMNFTGSYFFFFWRWSQSIHLLGLFLCSRGAQWSIYRWFYFSDGLTTSSISRYSKARMSDASFWNMNNIYQEKLWNLIIKNWNCIYTRVLQISPGYMNMYQRKL